MGKQVTKDELAELLPLGETVTVKGQEIKILPFKFGQLPQVLGHIGALAVAAEGDEFNLIRAFTEGGESVIACLVIATGKPREWFDTLEMDEGVALLTAVIKTNSDLFEKKILPLIGQMKIRTGQTSQPS